MYLVLRCLVPSSFGRALRLGAHYVYGAVMQKILRCPFLIGRWTAPRKWGGKCRYYPAMPVFVVLCVSFLILLAPLLFDTPAVSEPVIQWRVEAHCFVMGASSLAYLSLIKVFLSRLLEDEAYLLRDVKARQSTAKSCDKITQAKKFLIAFQSSLVIWTKWSNCSTMQRERCWWFLASKFLPFHGLFKP